MKAQYNRVSTIEQNEARQEITKGAKVYLDKCSGAIPFNERKSASKLLQNRCALPISEECIYFVK